MSNDGRARRQCLAGCLSDGGDESGSHQRQKAREPVGAEGELACRRPAVSEWIFVPGRMERDGVPQDDVAWIYACTAHGPPKDGR
jgi:hypothetical protein